MWLWYLELFFLTLAAFGVGALLGMLVVRLVVRRRADDPTIVRAAARAEPAASEPAVTSGAST